MINTKLHNLLMEEDIQQKTISASINTTLLKRELLKTRLINYSFIALFIMFVLILLMILYYFFPNRNFLTLGLKQQAKTHKVQHSPTPPIHLKNGIEYVKHDNFVFKRVWKDGVLLKEKRLAPTIEESRAIEKIPQFSIEKK